MLFIKKYWARIVLFLALLCLDVYWGEIFFTLLIGYGLFLWWIFSDYVQGNLRKVISIIIWVGFLSTIGLTFYVNRYMPHGPSYSTDEVVCQNDDRGPCEVQYAENLSKVNIPDWAKFLRTSNGKLLWMGLLLAGIVISEKNKIKKS